MVNINNHKNLIPLNNKVNKNLFKLSTLPCDSAPPGTQENVFCHVQKFPRIVVLPQSWGYLQVLQLNPCIEVGTTNSSCGFNCCSQPPFSQINNKITHNIEIPSEQPYNPNPPFPFVPPAQQIACYNLRSRLNQCDFNKRNFTFDTADNKSVLGQST